MHAMTRDEQLEKVRLTLLAAHGEIVKAAATMTAAGADTTALSGPVLRVTEALVELNDVLSAGSADDRCNESEPV